MRGLENEGTRVLGMSRGDNKGSRRALEAPWRGAGRSVLERGFGGAIRVGGTRNTDTRDVARRQLRFCMCFEAL